MSGAGALSDVERAWVDRAIRRGLVRLAQVERAIAVRSAHDPDAPIEIVLVSLGFLKEDELDTLGRTTRRMAAPAKPVAEPDVLVELWGSCTVLEPLGRGPTGPVYLALHGDTGRKVALKIVPPNALNRPFMRVFSRSVQIALGLKHPRAAKVIDGGLQNGSLYVAVELLKGTTLLEFVRTNGPMPADQAAALLAQVAGAVQAGHGLGLLHGNLKPENVFLTGKLEVKLTDYGLGRGHAEYLRNHADKAGTLVYSLAPEQWSAEPVPASDFYQLGVLWQFMLTGRYPFEGRAFLEVRRKHERSPPPPPSSVVPGIPASADSVAAALLEKEPGRRLASLSALLEALGHVGTPRLRTRRR
jgi:serine/threonine-protein kinase